MSLVPDLETLFGAPSFCECEDCRSVYSPAAYLVDLLHTIVDKNVSVNVGHASRSGSEVLARRRPDIGLLELSCENTNTPVPYIDLVNEILEYAVKSDDPSDAPQAATVGTAAELAANPQHVNEKAYATQPGTVASAVYPWTLPFDLWTEEARLYLGQLGVSRERLLAVFRKRQGEPLDKYESITLTDDAIIAEELGLTPDERDLIVGTKPPDLWLCWGYPDADVPNPDTPPNDWVKALGDPTRQPPGNLKNFLHRSGLQYEELVDLLATRFINPNGATDPNAIDFASDPPARLDSCSLTDLHLKGLTDPAPLSKMHRFTRLRRKLGWTTLDLEQALTAFQATDITGPVLVKLAHAKRLHETLHVPLPTVLSWWGTIDTRGDREGKNSLYQQLFQNRSLRPDPFSPTPDPFQLVPARDKLADELPAIPKDTPVFPTVLAALGLSAGDFAALVVKQEVDDALNLAALSKLYRVASFIAALKLTVREYLSLRALLSDKALAAPLDPFDPTDTTGAVRFVEAVTAIRASSFSTAELEYLLLGTASRPDVAPAGSTVVALLRSVRDGLQKIADENAPADDPTGELVRKRLAALLSPQDIEPAFAIVAGTSVDTPDNQTLFLQGHFAQLGQATVDALVQQLVPPAALPPGEPAARLHYVLVVLGDYLRQTASRSFVLQTLATAFNQDSAVTEKLLTGGAVASKTQPQAPALADFLLLDPQDFADWSDGLDRLTPEVTGSLDEVRTVVTMQAQGGNAKPFTRLAAQLETYSVLYRTAVILAKLRIAVDGLSWVLKDGVAKGWAGWLDPNLLPPRGTVPLFERWRRLVDLIVLRDALPAGVLWEFLGAVNAQDPAAGDAAVGNVLTLLSDRTRWRLDDLTTVTSDQVLNLQFPAEFLGERGLARITECMTLVRQLGAKADQAILWRATPARAEDARSIKGALKASVGDDSWLAVTKPLQDDLRERRRAALVAFLTGNKAKGMAAPFKDANALFDYFLIDVEMSACQPTSRIKQAIGAVQLFIQRCLMRLETDPLFDSLAPELVISEEAVHWWAWMRHYRVWEANRKVFLYPENWIHPELRDDKTPFFKDMENQLLQGDVTADAVEDAYRTYLDKLEQVARLEIVGVFHEPADANGSLLPPLDSETKDVLHVFGRTWGTPHVYFYRRRLNLGAGITSWTPWEKVNADIQGDHLIPVVWNRRMHVFWPVFTEKSEESTSSTGPPPKKYWEIQLAWSEYRNGKWTPKTLSAGPALRTGDNLILNHAEFPSRCRFRAEANDGNLTVNCYYTIDDINLELFKGQFSSACGGRLEAVKKGANNDFTDVGRRLVVPAGSMPKNQMFVENGADALFLPAGSDDPGLQQEAVLHSTPTPYAVLPPQQLEEFYSQDAFFYQDASRTFFVEPSRVQLPVDTWPDAEYIRPEPVYHGKEYRVHATTI